MNNKPDKISEFEMSHPIAPQTKKFDVSLDEESIKLQIDNEESPKKSPRNVKKKKRSKARKPTCSPTEKNGHNDALETNVNKDNEKIEESASLIKDKSDIEVSDNEIGSRKERGSMRSFKKIGAMIENASAIVNVFKDEKNAHIDYEKVHNLFLT